MNVSNGKDLSIESTDVRNNYSKVFTNNVDETTTNKRIYAKGKKGNTKIRRVFLTDK